MKRTSLPLRRREFIVLLVSAAAAWPLIATAQAPSRMRRIGVLMPFTEMDAEGQTWLHAFFDGLKDLGWVDGTTLGTDLHSKRIEFLKEAFPNLSRLAVLWDRNNDARGVMLDAMSDYAKRVGLRLDVIEGGRADILATALAPRRLKDADAILVSAGPTHFHNREAIVRYIAVSAKPAVYPEREYVTAGGLMSYGPSVTDVFRRLADHVDRILKVPSLPTLPSNRWRASNTSST